MRVRLAVQNAAGPLDIELADDTDVAALRSQVEEALQDDDNVLWLTDRKGQQFAVPVAKLAYLTIGSPEAEPRIGFGN